MTNTENAFWEAFYNTTEYGFVEVASGELRPAYARTDGTMYYSPKGAGAWRVAPESLQATFIHHYFDDEWKPFVTPDGKRIVA